MPTAKKEEKSFEEMMKTPVKDLSNADKERLINQLMNKLFEHEQHANTMTQQVERLRNNNKLIAQRANQLIQFARNATKTCYESIILATSDNEEC